MDIILFGMQGSGKGTQARLLMGRYEYQYFSVGDILRDIVKNEKSERSKKIASYINEGILVPDEIIFGVLMEFLKDAFLKKAPILFDGLPRNLVQYKMLKKLLDGHKREYLGIYFDLSLSETLQRIEDRKLKANNTESVREDDLVAEKILTRLEGFFVETFPVLKVAILDGRLKIISATSGPEEVFEQLLVAMGKRSEK